jgi:hypothetical protein
MASASNYSGGYQITDEWRATGSMNGIMAPFSDS